MFEKLFRLLNSIYPDLCLACDIEYPVKGSCFCVSCLAELPFTYLHDVRDNLVEKFFWGRLIVEKGTALFYFQKGELVQQMLHRLKYKNQEFIGKSLGFYFGEMLKLSSFMQEIDIVIPIPIHSSKLRLRNYNQSELIAKGIGSTFQIPMMSKNLIKKSKTPSQTDKTREERIMNLKNTFQVKKPEEIRGKHILLIDDILTTGSTLEAAGSVLSEYECKISVAVVAVGKY